MTDNENSIARATDLKRKIDESEPAGANNGESTHTKQAKLSDEGRGNHNVSNEAPGAGSCGAAKKDDLDFGMPSAEALQRMIAQQQASLNSLTKLAAAGGNYGRGGGDGNGGPSQQMMGQAFTQENTGTGTALSGNENGAPQDAAYKPAAEGDKKDEGMKTSDAASTIVTVQAGESPLDQAASGVLDEAVKTEDTEEDDLSKPKPPMINGMIDKQSLLNMKPKRPLSAYNFFFQEERSRLLGVPPCTEEEKKKRKHRKSHGKIAFTELAKHVGQKWKSLDKETKSVYEKKQSEDKKRYQKELSLYDQMIKEIHGMVGNDDDDDAGPGLASFKTAASTGGSKMARTKAAGAAAMHNDPMAPMGGAGMANMNKMKGNSGATPNQMAQLLNFQKQQQQQQMHIAQNQYMHEGGMGGIPGMPGMSGMGTGGMGGMGAMPGMGGMGPGGMGVMGPGGMSGMGPGGMGGMGAGGMGANGMGANGMGGMGANGMGGMSGMGGMPGMQGMGQGMPGAGADAATQAALGRERYERALLAAVYDKMMRGEGGQMPPGMNPAMMGANGPGDMMNGMNNFGGEGAGGSAGGANMGNAGGDESASGEKKHSIGAASGTGSRNASASGVGGGATASAAGGGAGGGAGNNMPIGMGMGGRGMPEDMDPQRQQEFQQQLYFMQQMQQQEQQMNPYGMDPSAHSQADPASFQAAASGQFPHNNWQNFY
jgi:hypothetical protein